MSSLHHDGDSPLMKRPDLAAPPRRRQSACCVARFFVAALPYGLPVGNQSRLVQAERAEVPGRRKTSRKSTSPTMVEVAEAAKVSIFTVSAVVNGTSHVSDTLRARTESAIRAIGYKRNGVARSLKLGRTKTVGVSVGDITNSFYTDVVSIIQRVLQRPVTRQCFAATTATPRYRRNRSRSCAIAWSMA